MQKKYFYGSLIAFLGIIGIWQVAANAQTWSGPKSGCNDPSQTDCNVDGVVWNRANFATAPVQAGNYKISGQAAIGSNFFAGGDLYVSSTKALQVNLKGTATTLNIGNYADLSTNQYPVNFNVYGNISANGVPNNLTPQITGYSVKGTNNLCIGTDCRTAWPSVGGGGTVTSVGSSNGLTGGPITGAGTLSIIGCTNGQVLKANASNQWACGTDIDTNSGGTISTINSPGGIVVTNPGGPTTSIAPDYTILDGRYVNVTGDTMTGKLIINQPNYRTLEVNGGNGGSGAVYGGNGTANGFGGEFYGSYGVYATTPNDATGYYGGYFSGYAGGINAIGSKAAGVGVLGQNSGAGSYGVEGYAVNGYGGYFTNNTTYSYLGGSGYGLLSNGAIYTSGDVTGGRLCIGADCRNAWPAGGSGTITGVTAGSGLTGGGVSGNVTLSMAHPSTGDPSDYIWKSYCTALSGGTCVGRAWTTAILYNGQGDITSVIAGNGLTGGASTGDATLNIGAGSGISVAADTVSVAPAGVNGSLQFNNAGTLGASNSLFWDNTNARLGLGTQAPSYRLDVDSRIRLGGSTAAGTAGIWFRDNTSATDQAFVGMDVYDSATVANRIWGIWFNNWNYTFKGDGTAAKIGGANTWTVTSDARLKKNIQPMTNALDKLSRLQGVNFEWKDPQAHFAKGTQGGFLAQDVERYFPEWVNEIPASKEDQRILGQDKEKAIGLDLGFDALVVESIKELKSQNEALQAKYDELQKRIEALEAKVE